MMVRCENLLSSLSMFFSEKHFSSKMDKQNSEICSFSSTCNFDYNLKQKIKVKIKSALKQMHTALSEFE